MKLLYLGLDPTRYQTEKIVVHRPIIQTEKIPFDQKLQTAFSTIPDASIVVLTSRISAQIFFEYCNKIQIEIPKKILYLAVGRATALLLPGAISFHDESSEGICKLMQQLSLDSNRLIFYPHSEQSRDILATFIQKKGKLVEAITYRTIAHPYFYLDDSEDFSEIVFTSPTCVRFFFEKKIRVRADVKLTTMGSITQNVLIQFLKQGKAT